MKLTVQELLLVLVAVRVHGFAVTLELEPEGPLMANPTVPWGALFVPLAVSVTVTVQVAGLLAAVESGQSTVVDVVRAMTSTLSVPLLAVCTDPAAGV
jgi:hypothetical protein